jgi:hypothetical protein
MHKARVLLAWEYGRNLGHLSCLHAVAAWTDGAGFEPIWVLPAAHRDQLILANDVPASLVAPVLPRKKSKRQLHKVICRYFAVIRFW